MKSNLSTMKQLKLKKKFSIFFCSTSAYRQNHHYIPDWNTCCILTFNIVSWRLLTQPIWEMQQERLREPRNDLTEEGLELLITSIFTTNSPFTLSSYYSSSTDLAITVLTFEELINKVFSLLPTFFRDSYDWIISHWGEATSKLHHL